MIPIFNRLNVKVSCLGNHEFDFGLARLKELTDQTKSPWLLSNLKLG